LRGKKINEKVSSELNYSSDEALAVKAAYLVACRLELASSMSGSGDGFDDFDDDCICPGASNLLMIARLFGCKSDMNHARNSLKNFSGCAASDWAPSE
jgi:hypothetical protein